MSIWRVSRIMAIALVLAIVLSLIWHDSAAASGHIGTLAVVCTLTAFALEWAFGRYTIQIPIPVRKIRELRLKDLEFKKVVAQNNPNSQLWLDAAYAGYAIGRSLPDEQIHSASVRFLAAFVKPLVKMIRDASPEHQGAPAVIPGTMEACAEAQNNARFKESTGLLFYGEWRKDPEVIGQLIAAVYAGWQAGSSHADVQA